MTKVARKVYGNWFDISANKENFYLQESNSKEDSVVLQCRSKNADTMYGSVLMDVELATKLRDALTVYINSKNNKECNAPKTDSAI